MKLSVLVKSSVAVVVLALAAFASTTLDTDHSAARPATGGFQVDPVHSALIFRVKYAGVSDFFGRFNEFSGSFDVDEKNLANTKFNLSVKTESVDSGNKKRDGHLLSPDFFSAKEHPAITFVSKSVKVMDGNKLAVTGDLTLRGVTKSVVAEVVYGGQKPARRGGTPAPLVPASQRQYDGDNPFEFCEVWLDR